MTSPTTPSLPDALRACIAKWRERRIGSIPRAVFEICISDVERALDDHGPALDASLRERDELRVALSTAVKRQGFSNDELIAARAILAGPNP